MAESSDIKNQKQSGVKNMNNMCKWLFNVSIYVYRNIHTSPEMHEIGKWLVEDTLTYVQYVLILNIYAPQIFFIFSLSRIDNNKIYPKISEYMHIICIAEKCGTKSYFEKEKSVISCWLLYWQHIVVFIKFCGILSIMNGRQTSGCQTLTYGKWSIPDARYLRQDTNFNVTRICKPIGKFTEIFCHNLLRTLPLSRFLNHLFLQQKNI